MHTLVHGQASKCLYHAIAKTVCIYSEYKHCKKYAKALLWVHCTYILHGCVTRECNVTEIWIVVLTA